MGFKSDIEIAQEAKPLDIREVGKKLGLTEDDLELYGKLIKLSSPAAIVKDILKGVLPLDTINTIKENE